MCTLNEYLKERKRRSAKLFPPQLLGILIYYSTYIIDGDMSSISVRKTKITRNYFHFELPEKVQQT